MKTIDEQIQAVAEAMECEWDLDNGAREPQVPHIIEFITPLIKSVRLETMRHCAEIAEKEILAMGDGGASPVVIKTERRGGGFVRDAILTAAKELEKE